jgi:CRISPR/Cas system Type II protein with McrA/HNH and RuvC-like nuclease domain
MDMNFFRRRVGYTLFDDERNEEILEQLKVETVDKKLRSCKSNCLQHVTRMNNRMPEIMLNYRPNG